MDGERDYYAATSGLTPATNFSLMDHARAAGIDPFDFAYWAGLSGLGNGFSLADHKRAAIGLGPTPDTYENLILDGNPLAYWRMGDASGAFTDSSGNGRSVTPAGAMTYGVTGAIAGDANKAITFAGGAGRIENAPWMDFTVFTIEAWVKTLDTVGQIATRDDGGNRSWQFGSNGGGKARLITWNAADSLAEALGATTIATDVWTHVAGTADGTNIRVFVNGVQDGITAQGPLKISLSALSIASNAQGTPGELLNGTLDEIALYGRALSAAELLTHASWTP